MVYKKLEQLWQRSFYVIKHTDGGTAIDPSCKSSTHGLYWSADPTFLDSTTSASHGGKSLLKAFERQIDDCLPNLPKNYDIKCLIWHQGESDQKADGSLNSEIIIDDFSVTMEKNTLSESIAAMCPMTLDMNRW